MGIEIIVNITKEEKINMSGIMSKLKNIFVPEDEYDEDEYEEMEQEEAPKHAASHTVHPAPIAVPKVVSLRRLLGFVRP